MQVMSSDDQILNQFANQKMHIRVKQKSGFKKYRKFEVEKYKNISIDI